MEFGIFKDSILNAFTEDGFSGGRIFLHDSPRWLDPLLGSPKMLVWLQTFKAEWSQNLIVFSRFLMTFNDLFSHVQSFSSGFFYCMFFIYVFMMFDVCFMGCLMFFFS